MPGCWRQGRGRGVPVQAVRAEQSSLPRRAALLAGLCSAIAGCNDPIARPLDLFHGLEGGAIAKQRPPPPGVGQPYPKLGTVPAKPVVADQKYRQSLQAQLATERDRTERVAADQPIETVPPPPGPPLATPHAQAPTAPASAGQTPAAQTPVANATLDTAEAPIPSVRAATAKPDLTAPALADPGPPAGTPLTIAGAPVDTPLPSIPDAPPPPATFEGVAAEPAPTQRLVPVRLSAPAGTQVFFPTASAVLPDSQTQALKDVASRRAGRTIEIIGLGDASADTPEGQATAVALALGRARAVADALAGLHVPQVAMRLGANAFGRGAVLRLLP